MQRHSTVRKRFEEGKEHKIHSKLLRTYYQLGIMIIEIRSVPHRTDIPSDATAYKLRGSSMCVLWFFLIFFFIFFSLHYIFCFISKKKQNKTKRLLDVSRARSLYLYRFSRRWGFCLPAVVIIIIGNKKK